MTGLDEHAAETTGGIRVSYTVKELLGRINDNLAALNVKLDMKADTHEVERLASRIDAQGERFRTLEHRVEASERRETETAKHREEAFSKREKLVALTFGAVAVVTPYLFHWGSFR